MTPVRLIAALLPGLILFCVADVLAWDGQRKGFVLGISMGPTYAALTSKSDGQKEDFSAPGFGGRGIFGYAPSNSAVFYVADRVDFFAFERAGAAPDETSGGGALALGIGFRYYLGEGNPSFYVDGGIGGDLWFYDPLDDSHRSGAYYQIAAGYEIMEYLSVEILATWHELSDGGDSNALAATGATYSAAFSVSGY